MQKVLVLAAAVCGLWTGGSTVWGQCAADFDFGASEYGASPDASLGEQFAQGTVGVAYSDVFHVLVPVDASAIDPAFALPLDSVQLISATLIDPTTGSPLDFGALGMSITCNNGGTAADPCTFLAGGQYCADIVGTPTQAGSYQMSLDVLAWVTVFGIPIGQPYPFTGYTLEILPSGANQVAEATAALGLRAWPNPSEGESWVTWNSVAPALVDVHDASGRLVHSEVVATTSGQWNLAEANLQGGTYTVSVTEAGSRSTTRVVVFSGR
jgi:hypothetical protein